ncbi:acyltransferase [Micromonospora echinospora]|uniref:Fucose 4-O-acetylase n=1 Tax=Micromonospora echinospora TaxID=1877 RepID=A0A1C4YPC6_MICEC|nr:acyltransferase [Micromonospora echinospora]OZV76834.1 acyltransferase [Micromonospora echinospora]SCF22201.1 Fucose 4-O-acetylase [Micromonospora echinospora]
MRRLRQLAERTPADRERYVDLLRAVAITAVVLGHWAVAVVGHDAAGRPTGRSALPDLPWAYPLTWLVQVMPVFFVVGGFANAASLAARRARGGDAADWLLDRSARLVRPTTVLVLVLAAGALVARLAGVDPSLTRTVVWFATVPLWFLAAYLLVVPLTPLTYALHRRYGLAVPLAFAALVGLGDLARLADRPGLAVGNYLFGWLAVHQLGYAWYDARRGVGLRFPPTRRLGWTLLLGGLATLVALTTVGPYPISMINIPGERLDNAAPPSLALLVLATTQVGLVMVLRGPAERWLRRPGPWQAVIAVNAVVLTVFLWHLSAAILLVGGLDAVGLLPTPPVGSPAWFAWRVPWLLMLSVVLAVLVAVFGPVEARTGRRPVRASKGRRPARGEPTARPRPPQRHDGPGPRGPGTGPDSRDPDAGPGSRDRPARRHPPPRIRAALAVVGFVAVVAALAVNAVTPRHAAEPLGLPVPALLTYLVGAGVLRLLREWPGTRDPTPPGSPR